VPNLGEKHIFEKFWGRSGFGPKSDIFVFLAHFLTPKVPKIARSGSHVRPAFFGNDVCFSSDDDKR
jgi:hypothetical protein